MEYEPPTNEPVDEYWEEDEENEEIKRELDADLYTEIQ